MLSFVRKYNFMHLKHYNIENQYRYLRGRMIGSIIVFVDTPLKLNQIGQLAQ